MERSDDVRVVILAGGEGRGLTSLTTRRDGLCVPKQFCGWLNDETLVQATLRRASELVPRQRVYFSLLESHATHWRDALADIPAGQLIRQPGNRGTGMGILLPLLHIYRKTPDATVVVLPSDHHIEDEDIFLATLERAITCARSDEKRAVLLGVTPDRPETDYGWVVPRSERDDGTLEVSSFVEKPTQARARELMTRGGMWSSLVLVGKVPALFRLYDRAAHLLLHVFLRSFQRNPDARNLESLYDITPPLDFSQDLLEACPELVRLLPMPNCGWADLGSPARVAACLRQRVGRRARHLRSLRGWNEAELARRSGLSVTTIERYEAGALGGDPALTADLASGLGVRLEDILGLDERRPRREPSLSRPLLESARLPPHLQNVVPMRRQSAFQDATHP